MGEKSGICPLPPVNQTQEYKGGFAKVNTPICDFVKKYADSESARFHMPGHKGKSFLGLEKLDITEFDGADVLYSANGIIKESMENASLLFETGKTLYSTEGSSLSIRAMLYLAVLYAKQNGKKPIIAAFRNVHKAFVSAAALLDFDVEWIYPKDNEGIISCLVSPEELEEALCTLDEMPTALYVTSPDYLGNIQDIYGFSQICKKYGILLLVDNAHGAYLKFLPKDIHPITLGADICCDSAHKTLPVLTGAGYLHISKKAPLLLYENAERAMSLFASTSPSYLILQSLDAANKYISENYKTSLYDACNNTEKAKRILSYNGYTVIGTEMLKITLSTKHYGYSGTMISKILASKGIVCEFCDNDYIVFMTTPENSGHLDKLTGALLSIEKRPSTDEKASPRSIPQKKLSIRQAMFSTRKITSVKDSAGQIFADTSFGCPPAIPVIISGEVIDENTIKLFEYYGIENCFVVKE